MTEITSYEQFAGLDLIPQTEWLASQLGIHFCIPQYMDILTADQTNLIKRAMIRRGWNYAGGYMAGNHNMQFYKLITDIPNHALYHHTNNGEPEAVIHAAAKALLGGK